MFLGVIQAWIKQTMAWMVAEDSLSITPATAADLKLLIKAVHTEAMVSIATASDILNAASCHETLILDVHHLQALSREYWCLVTSAALMTTARE